MECRQRSNADNCSCTYGSCPRKGVCCECIAYHRDAGELPACLFSEAAEKTYDRSVDAFISDAGRGKRRT